MHRIDGPGHSNHRFYRPSPDAIDDDSGTVLTAAWLNAVQEEIASVIESAGLALSKASERQLPAAIRKIANDEGGAKKIDEITATTRLLVKAGETPVARFSRQGLDQVAEVFTEKSGSPDEALRKQAADLKQLRGSIERLKDLLEEQMARLSRQDNAITDLGHSLDHLGSKLALVESQVTKHVGDISSLGHFRNYLQGEYFPMLGKDTAFFASLFKEFLFEKFPLGMPLPPPKWVTEARAMLKRMMS